MNAKAILFIAAIAASANTFAAGRDSVYAQPGASVGKSAKSVIMVEGRSSVYAGDLPAPVRAGQHAEVMNGKLGRA